MRSLWLVYLCGALLFGALFALERRLIDETVAAVARERGAALFSLVETMREWNAEHGGVYVAVSDATAPNPYLKHPERDLETIDGKRLTMVNPAFMTRQIAELASRADGIRLHITSLDPIRPANEPDPWEADALQRFEAGEAEVLALVQEAGAPVHRYMAPLIVREPCLQCHASQGYALGDIRGGISVTMPAEVLVQRRDELMLRAGVLYLVAFALTAGLMHGLLRANARHMRYVRGINVEQEQLIKARTGELAASEARYRAIFDSTVEGIMVTDSESRIVQVNPAFSEITGYSADEVLGRPASILASGRHDPAFFASMAAALARDGAWQGEIWNRRKDGDLYVQWMSVRRAVGPDGRATYVGTMSDITARKQAEETLRFRANHDVLTGLPNRALFDDRLNSAIAKARRHGDRFALMLVDLDRFKGVNDHFGHLAGDALLVEVGQRLLSCVRASDTVARLGGDEFAVVLEEIDGPDDAREVAERICADMARPFELAEGVAQIGASVGVALGPDDSAGPEALMRRADEALYAVKRSERGHYRFHAEGA